MTNKTKNLIIGGVALALAAAGIYLIFTGKKDDKPDPNPSPGPGPGPSPSPSPTPLPSSDYKQFKVTTLVSNLNVRKSPSTSSDTIGSLAKGSVVFAKPSGTTGWYEYSKDGRTSSGFVSSMYLTAI